jgi:hypothetical protein
MLVGRQVAEDITMTGCVVGEPDVYLFGGGYDHGRDVHNYSHRGAESRGAAHSGGITGVEDEQTTCFSGF